MILEQNLDHVSAKWDKDNNKWQVGQRTLYRWTDNNKETTSEWFNNIEDALVWIKEYDRKMVTSEV